MAKEKAGDMKHVLMLFVIIALLLIGSIAVNFSLLDVIYLSVLIFYMIRYIHIKRAA